jgi:tetratricopeptide (TPR) repeat protein
LGIIGEFDDAEQGLREAIELARKIENRNIEAAAYNSLGVIQNYRRRYREAIELHERAAQLFDALGDDFGLSLAINNAADAWLGLGELDKAAAMFRRALTLQERRKNRFQIAFALVNLAEVEVARRNDDVALPALLDALDAIQEYDDSWLLSLAAAQFACILARRGQFDKAAHFLGAAEAARERSGLVWAPTDLMALQEAEKLARSELRSGFEAAVERGKAWTLAETVSAAREVGAQEHFSAEAS